MRFREDIFFLRLTLTAAGVARSSMSGPAPATAEAGWTTHPPVPLEDCTLIVGGMQRPLVTIANDLSLKPLGELVATYGSAEQRSVGAGLHRLFLADTAFHPDRHRQLRLMLQAPTQPDVVQLPLAQIPWAMLAFPDDSFEGYGFFHELDNPVTVTQSLGARFANVAFKRTPRLLFVLPNPDPHNDTGAKQHLARILTTLSGVYNPNSASGAVYHRVITTFNEFAQSLQNFQPDIVHIMCHGMVDNGRTLLMFEGPGGAQLITVDSLRQMIGRNPPKVLLALCCHADSSPIDGVGRVMSPLVPAVVVSRMEARVEAAHEFAATFLESLVCLQLPPDVAFGAFLNSGILPNGDLAASWSFASLYANYGEWTFPRRTTPAVLDPQWKSNLPYQLDREVQVGDVTEHVNFVLQAAGSVAPAAPPARSRVKAFFWYGASDDGGVALRDRLRADIADIATQVALLETTLQWELHRKPSDEMLMGHVHAFISVALEGVRKPASEHPRVDDRAFAFPPGQDVLKATLSDTLRSGAALFRVLYVRHQPLTLDGSADAEKLARLLRLSLMTWTAITSGLQAEFCVILGIPIVVADGDAQRKTIFETALKMPFTSPPGPDVNDNADLAEIDFEKLQSHLRRYHDAYSVLDVDATSADLLNRLSDKRFAQAAAALAQLLQGPIRMPNDI